MTTVNNSLVERNFKSVLEKIAFEVPFETEWKNGTGYFDHAVDCYVPEGRVVKSLCPTTKRRIILVGTVLGTVVVFERYTPDMNQPFILTWHAPKALRAFIGEPALTSDTLERIVCTYYPQDNISKHVDALIEAGIKARAQKVRDHLNSGGEVAVLTPPAESYADATLDSSKGYSFAEVVAAVKAVNGLVMDDHRASIGGQLKLCGLATLDKDGVSTPIALIDDEYFSLNELYLDEAGLAHISTRAVAGVIHTPKSQNVTLEQGIAAYNKAMDGNRFSCGLINNVTML